MNQLTAEPCLPMRRFHAWIRRSGFPRSAGATITGILPLTCAIALTASIATTQAADSLPANKTTFLDPDDDLLLLASTQYLPQHLQYGYATADIPVTTALYIALAWHRDNYYSAPLAGGSLTTRVTMALCPGLPLQMSTTFATNLSAAVKLVYQGTVVWPTVAQSAGPAPWTHTLPLTSPYLYSKGNNQGLIIDIVTSSSTYPAGTHRIDAAGPVPGTRTSNGNPQMSCKFSNGNYNSGLSYTLTGLNASGGVWYVQYQNVLPNAPAIATLSGFGLDRPGPWPIPLNLPGAPGCTWNMGFELGFWVSMVADANGSARWPNLTIRPRLGGLAFYDHALVLDLRANALGLVATWSSKWQISAAENPATNTLFKRQDTASSPTGTLRSGFGPHIRLTR